MMPTNDQGAGRKATLLKHTAVKELKNMLGENECGVVQNRRITWQEIKTKRFDSKLLRTEEPDVYARYLKYSSYRRFQIK